MTGGHAHWEELAVGHAFAALEPEDEEVFLAHRRGCDVCARTLDETTAVAAHLAYAAEPAAPPAALHDAIVDAVRRSGRPVAFPEPVSARPQPPGSRLAETAPARSPRRSGLGSAGLAVGLVAGLVSVIGLGVWNTNLRANVAVKDAAIARLEGVGELAGDPATVRVAMTSGTGISGTALVRGAQAYVLLHGLPVNPAGTTYVLWYRDDQRGYHAIDTFDVREADHVNVVEAALDRPIELIAAIAVSREPGRSAPPTPSSTLLQGEVPD